LDKPVVSIVGADSVLGRELKDLIFTKKLKWTVHTLSSGDSVAALPSKEKDEALDILTALDKDSLAAASIVFLAGTPDSSRKAWRLQSKLKKKPLLIDLTHTLEDEPQARLADIAPDAYDPDLVYVAVQPAAAVLAGFLRIVNAQTPVERAVVTVFEPASERGVRGVTELQQQAIGLLSFRNVPKDLFDSQLCFTMLARYGSESPVSLADIELRLDRHLASLLAREDGIPMPSLRLVQAPVFHGYSFSVWVEFAKDTSVKALESALESSGVDVRGDDLEPPNNVGVAGQSGFAAGAIEADRNHPRAFWFWLAADNAHVAAETALAIAARMIEPGL
jgi:aspartate-semialdehyde dehydrogenase